MVVPTNEELAIARATVAVVAPAEEGARPGQPSA
jgi:hypothetical protein